VSTDRDVNRIVRSWLEEGVTALPDRVLDTVLDQLPATPQRRAPWPVRRLLDMNIPMRLAVAAAVVALAAVIGAIAIPKGGGVAAPQPTASPTPTVAPIPLPSAGAALAAGTYVMTPFLGNEFSAACLTPPQSGCIETTADDSVRITLTVPVGWETPPLNLGVWLTGKHNAAPDGASLFFERGGWLYSDPCHSTQPPDIQVGPSVDDFANALVSHPSLTVTTPVPVTLGGYSGKYMDLQIPSDISACTPSQPPEYWPWEPGFYAQGPSQRWHLWILDVSGTRVVVLTTDYAGTSAADRTTLQAIMNSIQIQP
jgi:hypothetical protein